MATIVVSVLEVVGLGAFVFYMFRALSAKIKGLENVVSAQFRTIETMDKRIEETEKISGIYRRLISDLPTDIENYKTIVSQTKDETIVELKNQKEETERKLQEATKVIEESGNPTAQIDTHLAVLKNLLSKPATDSRHIKQEHELKDVAEFNGRRLEDAVSKLVRAKTLEEFLQEMGFQVDTTDDDSVMRTIFSGERVAPDGEKVVAATASHSIGGGWHVIANDKIWMNDIRFSEWKDEFSAIKTLS